MRPLFLLPIILMFLFAFSGNAAYGEKSSTPGRLRLELSGGAGVDLGNEDRTGDFLLKSTLEYEKPVSSHLALGIRLLPLFLYEQDDAGEDTVWGGGLGVGGRLYFESNSYRGFFAEANTHVIGHDGKIQGNSSNINFLSGIGLGYTFKSAWYTLIKWEHISNARLKKENQGVDCVTVGVGFSF